MVPRSKNSYNKPQDLFLQKMSTFLKSSRTQLWDKIEITTNIVYIFVG